MSSTECLSLFLRQASKGPLTARWVLRHVHNHQNMYMYCCNPQYDVLLLT
jgi:hypothetical protein